MADASLPSRLSAPALGSPETGGGLICGAELGALMARSTSRPGRSPPWPRLTLTSWRSAVTTRWPDGGETTLARPTSPPARLPVQRAVSVPVDGCLRGHSVRSGSDVREDVQRRGQRRPAVRGQQPRSQALSRRHLRQSDVPRPLRTVCAVVWGRTRRRAHRDGRQARLGHATRERKMRFP